MAITVITQAHPIQPVFNTMQFSFSSDNFDKQGFRYVVDIYATDTDTLLSRQKVAPLIDFTGKIDISRIMANYVTYDFAQFLTTTDPASNSFFNYNIKIGEEYLTPAWDFTGTTTLSGYTRLNSTTANTHTYVNGSQVNIRTTNSASTLNGLHTVVSAISSTSVLVNVPFVSTLSGTTTFADNRKTIFSGLTSVTGLTIFNGVRSFAEYLNYSSNLVNVGTPNTIRIMLTDLPVTNFYATSGQTLWFNVMVTKTNPYNYCLVAESSNSASAITQCVSANDLREVVQLPFNFDDTGFDLDTTD